jgi:2-dehydro-3-deoxyphosphogalactonate aldolase
MSALIAAPPFVAILRGVTPPEAEAVAAALHGAGFQWMEVPLNSPDAMGSIARMRKALGAGARIGAGTVLSVADVEASAAAGADFIVSPNTDSAVIAATKARGLFSMPGFFTASEAFAALAAGADALKLFPADSAGPAYLKALKAVLAPEALVLAVGGIDEGRLQAYLDAGAAGFGLGGAVYRPGLSAEDVGARAASFMHAYRQIQR